ncbi:hemolysin family protein [Phenylobacterium sp.]|uniref:hemolysin family protein n=1 Tax=Phenylobacterium sp. TaxID=1871053 RepID=UPI0025FCEB98|nr:hemolysin family protein [Phenylobacterium sp.]MCA3720662.1 HlyC/CorC family transporter [Phenylobacterium sp.]
MGSRDAPAPEGRQGRGPGGWFNRIFGARGRDTAILAAEALTESAGGRLVDQAQAFQTLRVDDVMTPRADIVAVEVDTPLDEVVARFLEAEHSRMPIYRETLDDPLGVVHVKDVFKQIATGGRPRGRRAGAGDSGLLRLKREALYVPASMRAADLLLRMQATRIHLALVIDEFGGTDGLVTLEDLVEAVVGEIDDEHDEAQAAGVLERPDGVFEADARAPLEELEAALGRDLAPPDLDEEIDTVGGLVAAVAGRLPRRGEVIAYPEGYEIQVLDADPRRIKRVRIRPAGPPAAPAPG